MQYLLPGIGSFHPLRSRSKKCGFYALIPGVRELPGQKCRLAFYPTNLRGMSEGSARDQLVMPYRNPKRMRHGCYCCMLLTRRGFERHSKETRSGYMKHPKDIRRTFERNLKRVYETLERDSKERFGSMRFLRIERRHKTPSSTQ